MTSDAFLSVIQASPKNRKVVRPGGSQRGSQAASIKASRLGKLSPRLALSSVASW
jgi:hypothetical protein